MSEDPNDWSAGATVGSYIVKRVAGPDDGTTAEDFAASIRTLINKARELVDSVSHDNNGSIVGGQYMGGNGGLYSRETLKAADALYMELGHWR